MTDHEVRPEPVGMDVEELRRVLRPLLRTMLARRGAVRDRHAMLRDLRLELTEALTRAPTTDQDFVEAMHFRARFTSALDQEIADAEAAITAGFRHLPGVRR